MPRAQRKLYTVRLHLGIRAPSAAAAHAIALTLGESLADATENLDDPEQLVFSCVDDLAEVQEGDTAHGKAR